MLGLGARSLKGLSCAGAFAIFAAIGLASAAIAAQAQNSTKDSTNAAICAPSDETAVSPEQRIAACTALIETLKDQPKALAAVLTDRGATYWYINKSDLALKDLGHAIALDPTNARAFRERANTYRNLGRLDRALADANTSVQLDPNDPKAFDNRGNVFIDNRQYDRALADFNEALRLKPDFALAYHDRGDAFYFKQDYAASIKDLDEAIRLDPKSARAFTDRASTYAKLGRIDQAIAADTEAIRLEPLTPEFFDNRGLAYADNGDYDRAIADYKEAIRLRPEAKFLDNRGNSYKQRRARQPQRQSRRATAAGSTRLPCRAQPVIRQSAIQSASRNGIAARCAARHERTHELSLPFTASMLRSFPRAAAVLNTSRRSAIARPGTTR